MAVPRVKFLFISFFFFLLSLAYWDGVVPPDSQPTPSVLRLNADLQWEVAVEPLHRDVDNITTPNHHGVGPGLPFATALVSDLGLVTVGLVPAAYSGSTIGQWQRGQWLYSRLLERAAAATAFGSPITALLWFQGESDTVKNQKAKFGAQTLDFFNNLRADLCIPDLPIIQVAITSPIPGMSNASDVDIVRKIQFGLQLPNLKTVDSMGLAIGPDDVHLTTAAQVLLGRMLKEAYLL
ncbi:Domain of unknown function (DUF303 [Striga hermonthica]|uniref:Sialate O-acetylesterase domain-containing protein n=1 Tax=Striga hermonthica TaxID=68872 RepID=A0A9N7NV52_STRHE|nr:Domain of unknown function (DUF303 [Striga hermonthica]